MTTYTAKNLALLNLRGFRHGAGGRAMARDLAWAPVGRDAYEAGYAAGKYALQVHGAMLARDGGFEWDVLRAVEQENDA